MSPVNPQICTDSQAAAAAKHLEDAGLHVDKTFIPPGTVFGPPPGDKYNHFYLFLMFNGAIVSAALVVTEIRNNPSRWRVMLREDITRPIPTAAARVAGLVMSTVPARRSVRIL